MTEILLFIAESFVHVENADGNGSGSIIAHGPRNSYVLTCEHVVRGNASVAVVYRDNGRFVRRTARVVAADKDTDLALLRVSRRLPRPALPLAVREPCLFERALVMGSAAGNFGTPGDAIIASTAAAGNGKRRTKDYYQYTGFAVEGISGGILANVDGQLIGVPGLVERQNNIPISCMGYAVRLPVIKAFLDEHLPAEAATAETDK